MIQQEFLYRIIKIDTYNHGRARKAGTLSSGDKNQGFKNWLLLI